EIKVKEREELITRLKGGFIPDTELNSNPVSVEDYEWFNNVEKWLKMVASSSSQQQQKVPETPTASPQRQLANSTTPSAEDKVIPDAGQVKMLYALEKQNTKLQSMVSHYKDIICDTVCSTTTSETTREPVDKANSSVGNESRISIQRERIIVEPS
ncbi:hypothetical protein U1Q18_050662, partial [Sarracenia purpurea var. burkii]